MYDLTNKIYCGPIHCRITPSLNFLSRIVAGEWLDSDSGLQIFLSLLSQKTCWPSLSSNYSRRHNNLFFSMVSQGSIFVQWKIYKKKKAFLEILKRQNWFANFDFLERNMQMERKWAKFGKLYRKSIRNRKINNVMQNLCIRNYRNETNKAWKGEGLSKIDNWY